MKKGLLLMLSLALAVFSLSAVGLTINAVSRLKELESIQTQNVAGAQKSTAPESVAPATSSAGNKKAAARVPPQTSIDENTAINTARSDAGVAVFSGNKPELVDLDGHTAYEVIFDLGKIYVDANSGKVLSNTIQITPEIAVQVASKVLQINQVIRVDLGVFQGQNYYIVQFRGGVNAYVSMKGVVTYISTSQPSGQVRENDD